MSWKVAITSDVVTCDVVGDPVSKTGYRSSLQPIEGASSVVDKTFSVLINQTTYANLTVENWGPPGPVTLMVEAYDEYESVIEHLENVGCS